MKTRIPVSILMSLLSLPAWAGVQVPAVQALSSSVVRSGGYDASWLASPEGKQQFLMDCKRRLIRAGQFPGGCEEQYLDILKLHRLPSQVSAPAEDRDRAADSTAVPARYEVEATQ